jgi:polyhydroxyalkanoate synthesis regulator phasin
MDERGNADFGSAGEPARSEGGLRQLALAAVGAVSLTAERADELAEALADRGGMRKDDVRAWIDETTSRWRGDATRFTERAGEALHGTLRDLGLVTRTEWDELELRVAQLEHRLRLVEAEPRAVPERPS